MSSDQTDRLLDAYFDGGLEDNEYPELNDLLLNSPSLRQEFRSRVKVHGALTDRFSETTTEDFEPVLKFRQNRFGTSSVLVGVAAMLLFLFAIGLIYVEKNALDTVVARVIGTSSIDDHFERGESLSKGEFELHSGMLELAFARGVRVAIEAPARFEILSPVSMSLQEGLISVDAGKRGKGFTVITPVGDVVDHGTRFGVRIGDDGKSAEAHVFEGAVDVVRSGENVRLVTDEAFSLKAGISLSSDPSAFPMPGQTLNAGFVNGGFEGEEIYLEGMPEEPGNWGGDRRELVGSAGGDTLRPHSGGQMLKFLSTRSTLQAAKLPQHASELWQIVDLSEFTDRVNGGEVSAKMEAQFNRLSGVANSAFEIQLFAFRGQMSLAEDYWDRKNEPSSEKLASAGASVLIDGIPGTWEPLEVSMAIPPGTDFLLVNLLAFENETEVEENEFMGHFADSVQLTLTAKARESIPSARWNGEGDWKKSANWHGGDVPDPSFDRVDISGEGESLVSRRVIVKQSLVLAGHNGAKGRLRISSNGELIKSGFGELLVGFNPGAIAELIVEGKLQTQTPSFIGRNNHSSLVDIDGGQWDAGESLIRMAQYGERGEDTKSRLLIRNGGAVSAGALEMIHDHSVVRVESGELRVGTLRIGGEDGTASITLKDGFIEADRLSFGPGEAHFNFERGIDGEFRIAGEWSVGALWDLEGADWRVDGKKSEPSDFVISVEAVEGEVMTRMRLKNTPEN